MAIRYQFPCPHCGAKNALSATMAGQQTQCSQCNATFEVPQLKLLKQFEPTEPPTRVNLRQSSQLQSILFVLGFLLFALGTASGYFLLRYSQPMLVDFSNSSKEIEEMADSLKPDAVLREWFFVEMKPELPEWQEHRAIRYNTQGQILTKISYGLFVIGGVGLLLLGWGIVDGYRSSNGTPQRPKKM